MGKRLHALSNKKLKMEKKPLKNVLYVIGIFFIIYLFTLVKQCSETKETVPVKIETPAKRGSFEKPTEVIQGITKKDSIVYKKGSTIYTENPINKQLAEDYLKSTDSIKRLKLYLDAIQEKDGTYIYDNKDLRLEIYTKTRGELLEIKPNYTIKPSEVKVDVPVPQTILAMYGGLELGNNSSLSNLSIKADVGIQNKKGTIFSVGADTRGNYFVGAKVKFLDIKK
jgi:hypothetical protein